MPQSALLRPWIGGLEYEMIPVSESVMGRAAAIFISLAALVSALNAADLEQPVGVMLSAGGSKVLRAGTETPLASRPGDLLFVGDELRASDAAASFLFVLEKRSRACFRAVTSSSKASACDWCRARPPSNRHAVARCRRSCGWRWPANNIMAV